MSQVGLQRAVAAVLEAPNPLKCLEERFLHKVLGVGDVTGPSRQATAGPTLEPGAVPRDQGFERHRIASLSTFEERQGR